MVTYERTSSPNPSNSHEEKKMKMKSKLSILWIFATLNYLYCDVIGLFDPELVPPIEFTPGVLLEVAVLVEIFIVMVLLSRVLPYRANRWANIAAGVVMTVVQSASLFVGVPALYYVFFSVIEITTTVFIVWFAWNWRKPDAQVVPNEPKLSASRG